MASNAWMIQIGLLQLACLAQGGTIMDVHMVTYKNPGGKDWKDNRCDYFGRDCDHKFTFCFDQSSGECLYGAKTTGEFKDKNEIKFDHDMANVENPIQLKIPYTWPGAIRFKVKIMDDDYRNDDLVDKMNELWTYIPARSVSQAKWHRHHIVGTRASSPTSLVLNVRMYCDVNYYTSRCAKYCKATDGPTQHYTCHPIDGDKVCRPGWEGNYCHIRSDDCIDNKCSNGAICIDGSRRYTCICVKGFTGEHCETNIDDCAGSPCENNGTCIDQLDDYQCTCKREFVGARCTLSICHASVSPCQNGGTCYVDERRAKCLCPLAFSGDDCARDKCREMSCENQGTCEGGTCHCRSGYIGHLCDVNICQTMTCLNGATCHDGVCLCTPNYTGKLCQTQVNACESDPCHHESTCRHHSDGGYHCRCLPGYNGTHCEHVVPTQSMPLFNHKTTPVTGSHRSPATKAEKDNTSNVQETSEHQSVYGWVVGLIVTLLVIVVAVIVAFIIMRRRPKKKESSAEAAVVLHIRTDEEAEGATGGICNPEYSDGQSRADNYICGDCQGATPPPYSGPRRVFSKISPVYEAAVQNR